MYTNTNENKEKSPLKTLSGYDELKKCLLQYNTVKHLGPYH